MEGDAAIIALGASTVKHGLVEAYVTQPLDPNASRRLDAVVIAYEGERDPLLRAWLAWLKGAMEDRFVPPYVPEGRGR